MPEETNSIAAASPHHNLTDFPDWLSPMLVKELRQGLRTNMFVFAFILLQTFMILCLMISTASPGSSETDGFFWFFIYVTLLLVQPLRGANALSGEFSLNTMDLIQLTRLKAWRITLGKWTALNAQTLLLIIGIIPYLVMRYFLGGVNFINDLGTLGGIALGSALVSAITVGTSAFRSTIIRVIILIALFICTVNAGGMWSMRGMMGSSSAPNAIATYSLMTFTAVYGGFFFLSMGASRIAPRSENLSTRKRISSLLFVIATLGFAFFSDLEEFALTISGLALAIVLIDAITEPVPLTRAVAVPFSKNFITRFAAHFLTPGWHTGIRFFLIASSVWLLGYIWIEELYEYSYINDGEDWVRMFSLVGIITFPLCIIHLFFRKRTDTSQHFNLYLIIQLTLLILTILLSIAASTSNDFEDFIYYVAPIPSMLQIGSHSSDADGFYFFLAAIATAYIPIVVALVSSRHLTKELQTALKQPPSTETSPDAS